jgi:hypothetical protein
MLKRVLKRLWLAPSFYKLIRVEFPWWELQPFDFVVMGTFFHGKLSYIVMLELATDRLFYYVKVQEGDSHESTL